LLLQRGTVSKPDLISALREVTALSYIDCTEVQVTAEVLKAIPAEMARQHDVLPVSMHNGKLTVAMAEPQNLRLIDELRFKTGKEIVPRLGFHSEIREAVGRHYGREESGPTPAIRTEYLAEDIEGMEFISSSEQQRNIEAMREIQAELLQKSKTPRRCS